jgi:hypothetical protein
MLRFDERDRASLFGRNKYVQAHGRETTFPDQYAKHCTINLSDGESKKKNTVCSVLGMVPESDSSMPEPRITIKNKREQIGMPFIPKIVLHIFCTW